MGMTNVQMNTIDNAASALRGVASILRCAQTNEDEQLSTDAYRLLEEIISDYADKLQELTEENAEE